MLLSISRISFCQLQELLKVPFHSFRNIGLDRKTITTKVEINVTINLLLLSSYLVYAVCNDFESYVDTFTLLTCWIS